MKELLIIIAKNLVESPQSVTVEEEERDNVIVLKLRVAPEDMGKVIGKQGRIAKAIRTLVKASSVNSSKKVLVEIVQ
ncbi:MAG: KH domain-containing protein [Turicibacter sp.]|nr:KH domain-containing protein [Turicibacter sp.]